MCKHSDFTYNEAWYINKIVIVLACVLLFQVGIRRACFNVKCSGTYRNLNESTHFVLKSFKKNFIMGVTNRYLSSYEPH